MSKRRSIRSTNAEFETKETDVTEEDVDSTDDTVEDTTEDTVVDTDISNNDNTVVDTTDDTEDENSTEDNEKKLFSDVHMEGYAELYLNDHAKPIADVKSAIDNFTRLLKRALDVNTPTCYEELLNFFIAYKNTMLVEKRALQGINKLDPRMAERVGAMYSVFRGISTNDLPKTIDLEFIQKSTGSEVFKKWVSRKIRK